MDDAGYERIYYQTIADTGIVPLPVGIGPEGIEEAGSAGTVARPTQLAARAIASASEGKPRAPRKRAAKKASGVPTGEGANTAPGATLAVSKPVKKANARIAAVPAARTSRSSSAKVASSPE